MSGSKVRCSLFAGVLAGLSLLASGCASSKSPSVASLGATTSSSAASSTNAGSGNSATTGNPAQMLDDWAACMRSHGVPNQADPTIDDRKAIHIALAPKQGVPFVDQFKKPCQTYLTEAEEALRGGKPFAKPDTAKLLAFSECMRAHGIPDFPDPSHSGLVVNGGGDLNPNNPTFQNASKVCAKKTGVQGFGGTPSRECSS